MGTKNLHKELERWRARLEELYSEKGEFLNQEVIEYSQKMDKLIVDLMLKEKNKKDN